MKLWIDDVRPAPEGYIWCKSVNESKDEIVKNEYIIKSLCQRCRELDAQGDYDYADEIHMAAANTMISDIDLDHDAGDYVSDGGDYIKLLDWLEETKPLFWLDTIRFHIHSMNPVGAENMRAIIKRNGWKEV
jgi:hypothetical protein